MFYMKCNLINSQWFSLHTNNSVIKILWAQVVYLNILRTFYHPCCFWLLLKPSCLKAERTLITSWRFTLSILEKAPPEAIIQVWCVKLVVCPDKALWHSYPQLILFIFFSEKSRATRKVRCHKRKKSKSETEASLSKRSKKSSRKKKKKKKKKDEAERRKCSSSDGSSDDSRATKDEQQRKKPKSRHKNKKTEKNRARDVDGNSSGSNSEEERERRTRRYKKRKQDSL